MRSVDTLDDLPVTDRQLSFVRGQVSAVEPVVIAEDSAALLRNMRVLPSGEARPRPGVECVSLSGDVSDVITGIPQGMTFFSAPNVDYVCLLAGGHLYRIGQDGYTKKLTSSQFWPSGRGLLVPMSNGLWVSSRGSSSIRYWTVQQLVNASQDGHNISSTVGAPPHAIAMQAHKFRIYIAADQDHLYVSKFLPDQNNPFALEGDEGPVEILPVRIGSGESDPIMAIVPWKGFQLVVFKRYSIWWVDTEPLSTVIDNTLSADFRVECINSRIGCVAPGSVQPVGDDILFLSDSGIYAISKLAQNVDILTEPLSAPISDVINSIDYTKAANFVSTTYMGCYVLAVTMAGSDYNNMMLVYQLHPSSWTVWDGLNVQAFSFANFAGKRSELWMAHYEPAQNATVIYKMKPLIMPEEFDETVYRDKLLVYKNGSWQTEYKPQVWKIKTRAFSFGDISSPKKLSRLRIEYISSACDVDIFIEDNEGSLIEVARGVKLGGRPLILPFKLADSPLGPHPVLGRKLATGGITAHMINIPKPVRYCSVIIMPSTSGGVIGAVGIKRVELDAFMLASAQSLLPESEIII